MSEQGRINAPPHHHADGQTAKSTAHSAWVSISLNSDATKQGSVRHAGARREDVF